LKQTGLKLSVILAVILIVAGIVGANSIVRFVPKQLSYVISQDEPNYYLSNRDTGQIAYTSTDARSVFMYAYNTMIFGGNVFVKNGMYNLTGSITPSNNSVTEGESWNAILAGEVGSSTIFYLPGTSSGHFVNIEIKNLQLDGSRMSSGKGLYGTYIDELYIEQNWVHDTPHTGIGPDFITNFEIKDNLVQNCAQKVDGNGIGVGGPSTIGIITNNIVTGTNKVSIYGFGIVLESLTTTGIITDVIVSDNIAKSCKNSGFLGKGIQQCVIEGNIFAENAANGIYLYDWDASYRPSSHVDIRDNNCHNNTDSGIRIRGTLSASRDIFVTGNDVSYNYIGIITYMNGTAVTNNFVTYNTYGIYLYRTDNYVAGNTNIGNAVDFTWIH
jgi:hypothetical protein